MFGLDLSAEKQFKNGISIFFKANNLLDAKRKIRSEIVKSDYNIIARLNKKRMRAGDRDVACTLFLYNRFSSR